MLVVATILQYLRCLVSMPCSQPVEKRRLWEGLTEAFQDLKGAEKKHREKFLVGLVVIEQRVIILK